MAKQGEARILFKERKMKKVKVTSLVLDFDMYPRNNIDSKNVSDIAEALRNGAEVPPVISDKKSKRVVDGFHRVKAHLIAFGPDAEIMVIEKSYKSERELFLDAVRYNAHHGAKLDSYDKSRILLRAEELKIDIAEISEVLSVSTDKLSELRVARTATSSNMVIPIKRTIQHMAGKRLNKRQKEANKKLSGMNQVFYVNQVIELLEADLLDTSDELLMKRLLHLGELINGVHAGIN